MLALVEKGNKAVARDEMTRWEWDCPVPELFEQFADVYEAMGEPDAAEAFLARAVVDYTFGSPAQHERAHHPFIPKVRSRMIALWLRNGKHKPKR